MALTQDPQEFPASLYLDAMVREGLVEKIGEGIEAWVRMYYYNFTDARYIEPAALQVMRNVIDFIEVGLDLEELIAEVEESINASGGVRSEDDEWHLVCTFPEEGQ